MSDQPKREEMEARELSLEEMDNVAGGSMESAEKKPQEQNDKGR